MAYRRILTIQDISCVGQCSLTVALPILSACGHETAILPSAVLSTHTAGFSGWTCRDLTEDMPAINAHWNKEGLRFEAVYTGYLGSTRQIDYVKAIMNSTLTPEGLRIVDPAMADHGKLYPAFDMEYVEAMKSLCAAADYLLPNVTEACALLELPWEDSTACTQRLVQRAWELLDGRLRNVLITSCRFSEGWTGLICAGDNGFVYPHERVALSCHGSGDLFASVFAGLMTLGRSLPESARTAADFTRDCIRHSMNCPDHRWYGVDYEPMLGELTRRIGEERA